MWSLICMNTVAVSGGALFGRSVTAERRRLIGRTARAEVRLVSQLW